MSTFATEIGPDNNDPREQPIDMDYQTVIVKYEAMVAAGWIEIRAFDAYEAAKKMDSAVAIGANSDFIAAARRAEAAAYQAWKVAKARHNAAIERFHRAEEEYNTA